MTSIEKGGEVLKFAACLRALLFQNNRSIVHFCQWGWGGGGGGESREKSSHFLWMP